VHGSGTVAAGLAEVDADAGWLADGAPVVAVGGWVDDAAEGTA